MKAPLRVVATIVLLTLLALMIGPFQEAEAASGVWDKAAHFIAFGLILWTFGVLFRRLPRLWAAGLAIGLGGAVEVVQGLVGRDASWGDLIADGFGVVVALALWAIWRGFRPRAAFQTSNTR